MDHGEDRRRGNGGTEEKRRLKKREQEAAHMLIGWTELTISNLDSMLLDAYAVGCVIFWLSDVAVYTFGYQHGTTPKNHEVTL